MISKVCQRFVPSSRTSRAGMTLLLGGVVTSGIVVAAIGIGDSHPKLFESEPFRRIDYITGNDKVTLGLGLTNIAIGAMDIKRIPKSVNFCQFGRAAILPAGAIGLGCLLTTFGSVSIYQKKSCNEEKN